MSEVQRALTPDQIQRLSQRLQEGKTLEKQDYALMERLFPGAGAKNLEDLPSDSLAKKRALENMSYAIFAYLAEQQYLLWMQAQWAQMAARPTEWDAMAAGGTAVVFSHMLPRLYEGKETAAKDFMEFFRDHVSADDQARLKKLMQEIAEKDGKIHQITERMNEQNINALIALGRKLSEELRDTSPAEKVRNLFTFPPAASPAAWGARRAAVEGAIGYRASFTDEEANLPEKREMIKRGMYQHLSRADFSEDQQLRLLDLLYTHSNALGETVGQQRVEYEQLLTELQSTVTARNQLVADAAEISRRNGQDLPIDPMPAPVPSAPPPDVEAQGERTIARQVTQPDSLPPSYDDALNMPHADGRPATPPPYEIARGMEKVSPPLTPAPEAYNPKYAPPAQQSDEPTGQGTSVFKTPQLVPPRPQGTVTK